MTNDKDLGDMIKEGVAFTVEYLTLSEFGPELYPNLMKKPEEKKKPTFDYTKEPRRLPKLSPECEQAIDNMQAMMTYRRGMELSNALDDLGKRDPQPEP